MTLSILAEAEKEIDNASDHYEDQQSGLGVRFRNEVLVTLHRIQQHPLAYQQLSEHTRRCLVTHFPYGIIYEYEPETHHILVYAIAHLHRKPDYWSSRNS